MLVHLGDEVEGLRWKRRMAVSSAPVARNLLFSPPLLVLIGMSGESAIVLISLPWPPCWKT